MPIEELVFFVVVPICGLLTYEAVGHVLGLLQRRSKVGEAGPGA
jgi:lycopene beta-cyclase